MQIFKTPDIDRLKSEMDSLGAILLEVKADRDRIEAQIECFENGAFEAFRVKVLEPEMNRLAHLRMNIDTKDTELHNRALGQYNEAKLMASKKAELENELKFSVARYEELSVRMDSVTKRYNKRVKGTNHG